MPVFGRAAQISNFKLVRYKNTLPALSCTLPDALGKLGEGSTSFTCKVLYYKLLTIYAHLLRENPIA